MKLLTKEIRNKIPKLYSQEKIKDPIVHVKFFTPWSDWTWYATEGEPDIYEGKEVDFRFFGFVEGDFPEWGYFCLNELASVKNQFGLKIERDKWFEPQLFSNIQVRR